MNDPDFRAMIEGIQATSGLTMTRLAECSGLSRQHLHRLRNGEVTDPRSSTAQRLERLQRQYATPIKRG